MEELACPRCKTTKYRNPSLKLMINVCGHTLCELCVDLLFLKGSGACPECNLPLRRNNFRVQLFEDPMVEKEVDIRRRILRDYNKKEDDFPTMQEYNDYLEEIEYIIYNLCNNIDIINTNKRIEAYKRENREAIMKNKSRMGREEYELEEMLEMEKAQKEARRHEIEEFDIDNQKKKIRQKQDLIEKLATSDRTATELVTEYVEQAEKIIEEEKHIPAPKPATQFSTGIKFGGLSEQMFLPVPKVEEGPLYVHKILSPYMEGPKPPPPQDIESNGFMQHIRSETSAEWAGGYSSSLACQRALHEAMQGLYHGHTSVA